MFHMRIPCDKTFLLVPSSRLSVKVKVEYQGHNFQKMAVEGAFMFHKPILFSDLMLKYCLPLGVT